MSGFSAIAAFGLLLVRPGMLVLVTPFFGALNAPTQVRVGVTAILAFLLAPVVQTPQGLSLGGLALVVTREAAIGLALALAIRTLIFAAEFAGQFAGYQLGFSMGALIDPQSGVRNNALALLYGNVAVVVCLASNAHHALVRALVESYRSLPIGAGGVDGTLADSVSRMFGLIFVLGVRIAAPVIVVLLVVELALGLLGRVAPSLNVVTAGAPVRVVVGLLVVAASLTAVPPLLVRYLPTALDGGLRLARAFR